MNPAMHFGSLSALRGRKIFQIRKFRFSRRRYGALCSACAPSSQHIPASIPRLGPFARPVGRQFARPEQLMRRKSTLTDALQFAWLHLDTGAVCRENGTSGDAPFASALELRGAVSMTPCNAARTNEPLQPSAKRNLSRPVAGAVQQRAPPCCSGLSTPRTHDNECGPTLCHPPFRSADCW
jgi:hypothetical protein